MQIRSLAIKGAWEFTPTLRSDERGTFLEQFTQASLHAELGRPVPIEQVNTVHSRAGVVRGIHFADVPPGQAKYVSCAQGVLWDVIVDIRTGSPTFGQWQAVELSGERHNAVYVSEGLGHGYMALTEDAIAVYLCSTGYNPGAEHGISPLDPQLGIVWPTAGAGGEALAPILTARDRDAPTLGQAQAAGMLPGYAAVTEWEARLRERAGARSDDGPR